jgi:hypothetical protein
MGAVTEKDICVLDSFKISLMLPEVLPDRIDYNMLL